ncbi:unnamed protein product [Parnassius apollo]|uniref:(apollo) hypothetical protein n=1 Tax=Parnassius apollo TaxID=110799 RepID=A0A8S3YFU0_PARAO|nr:unnamed protein product [Parnassius apollo]
MSSKSTASVTGSIKSRASKTSRAASPTLSTTLRKKVLIQNAATSNKATEDIPATRGYSISEPCPETVSLIGISKETQSVNDPMKPEKPTAVDSHNITTEMGQEADSENRSSLTLDMEAELEESLNKMACTDTETSGIANENSPYHRMTTSANILEGLNSITTIANNIITTISAVRSVTSDSKKTCRASMPMKNNGTQCKPIWWTDKLEKLKKDVISLHHKIHHTKRKGLALNQLLEERNRKKKEYGDELRRTSTDNFREFCERQGKENVWSVTNRLLKETKSNCSPSTLKVGNSYNNDEKETAKALINHFYPEDSPDSNPAHEKLRKNREQFQKQMTTLPLLKKKLWNASKNMNPKRAPGIDNLTADICTQFSIAYPKLITEIMNRCLSLQYFPQQWKIAHVKIIPKPNKSDCTNLNSFRPIGLLPVFGKLLEKLFINRIKYQATRDGRMSNRQLVSN